MHYTRQHGVFYNFLIESVSNKREYLCKMMKALPYVLLVLSLIVGIYSALYLWRSPKLSMAVTSDGGQTDSMSSPKDDIYVLNYHGIKYQVSKNNYLSQKHDENVSMLIICMIVFLLSLVVICKVDIKRRN